MVPSAGGCSRDRRSFCAVEATLSLLLVLCVAGCGSSGTATANGSSTDSASTPQAARKAELPPGVQTRENSIGMRLVAIPAGRMLMGSPQTDEDARPDELPQHPVEIADAFEIGMYEVTVGQYRKFVEATDYKTLAERDKGGFAFNRKTKRLEPTPGSSWKSTGFEQSDEHPVINVAYEDAIAFCQWLSKKESTEYRLPSELEWEYACRAGTETKWSCGDDVASLREYSNLCDSTLVQTYPFATWCVDWNDGFPFTAPVGTFRPNAFGLFDMHGNVFEWCTDHWPDVGYDGKKLFDPDEPMQPGSRVIRGGSFLSLTTFLRSADRVGLIPQLRNCIVGFRVVRAGSSANGETATTALEAAP